MLRFYINWQQTWLYYDFTCYCIPLTYCSIIQIILKGPQYKKLTFWVKLRMRYKCWRHKFALSWVVGNSVQISQRKWGSDVKFTSNLHRIRTSSKYESGLNVFLIVYKGIVSQNFTTAAVIITSNFLWSLIFGVLTKSTPSLIRVLIMRHRFALKTN